MRRFMAAVGSTVLGVLRRRWLLMLLLAALPVWFIYTRLRSTYDEWIPHGTILDHLRWVPGDPFGTANERSFSPTLEIEMWMTRPSAITLRNEHLVDMLVWSGAIAGVVVLSFLIVWLIDYVARYATTVDPNELSVRNSTPHQVESTTPQREHSANSEERTQPPSPVGPYTVVQRPNQELLIRALNMYRDVMRRSVLDRLRLAYGQDAGDAIRSSLGDEGAESFERELARNRGRLEETLDVGHFRAVIENNWYRCFAAQFEHDRTVLGTVGWINGARNRASHPGTEDLPREEVVAAINNIGMVLSYIGVTDMTRILEVLKTQAVRSPEPDTLPASVHSLQAVSRCANARCTSFNAHAIDGSGESTVRCGACSTEYSSRTFDMVRVGPYRGEAQHAQMQNPYTHTLRIRLPDGREDLLDLRRGYQVEADLGDTITVSYDRKGNMVYLVNHPIDRTWYFDGGDYRRFWQRPGMYVLIVALLVLASCQYGFYYWGSVR